MAEYDLMIPAGLAPLQAGNPAQHHRQSFIVKKPGVRCEPATCFRPIAAATLNEAPDQAPMPGMMSCALSSHQIVSVNAEFPVALAVDQTPIFHELIDLG